MEDFPSSAAPFLRRYIGRMILCAASVLMAACGAFNSSLHGDKSEPFKSVTYSGTLPVGSCPFYWINATFDSPFTCKFDLFSALCMPLGINGTCAASGNTLVFTGESPKTEFRFRFVRTTDELRLSSDTQKTETVLKKNDK